MQKQFIVALLMAATIQAADDTTKTDAATTPATGGTRTEGMMCDGAVAKSGCAEGLRCHTGATATKQTPEQVAAAKTAADALTKKYKDADDAYNKIKAENEKNVAAFQKTTEYTTWLAAKKLNEKAIVDAKAQNETANTNNALFTAGAKDKAAYDAAVLACKNANKGTTIKADGTCLNDATLPWDFVDACDPITRAIAATADLTLETKAVTATATFACKKDKTRNNVKYTFDKDTAVYTWKVGSDPANLTDEAAAKTAFGDVAANIADRYATEQGLTAALSTTAPELVYTRTVATKDDAVFVWQELDPVPAAYAVKEPAQTPPLKDQGKNSTMLKAEAAAAAKKVADDAAAAAKKGDTKDATKTETKPAATTTTEPAAGPGACGKAEACDTEVAGAKVYCGAQQLAAGLVSAVVIASMI